MDRKDKPISYGFDQVISAMHLLNQFLQEFQISLGHQIKESCHINYHVPTPILKHFNFSCKNFLIGWLKNADWKSKMVFLVDGTPYHKFSESIKFFEKLNLRLIVSTPYSFDEAAAELVFA